MDRITTIKDIANELGISTSTVSRILNGKNTSNSALAEKVMETAKRLKYQVNTAAKGLRTNKTQLIGIIVPEIRDDFFASVLSGMEEAAEINHYNLLLCQSNESHKKEVELVKSLIACNVEGILVSVSKETSDLGFLNQLLALGKKAVSFDRTIEHPEVPSVTFSDFEGAALSAKHLIDLGHKSFLYFGFAKNLKNDQDRHAGYDSVLEQNGLTPCKAVYVDQYNFTVEDVKDNWSNEYDTIVCFNDMIAAQVLAHLRTLGIKVPEEVSVVGFDNRVFCDFTYPKLTSVEHSTRLMGKHAVNMLLNLINETETESVGIGAELVPRDSTMKR